MKNILIIFLSIFILLSCEKESFEPVITSSEYEYSNTEILDFKDNCYIVQIDNYFYEIECDKNILLEIGDIVSVKYNRSACYIIGHEVNF